MIQSKASYTFAYEFSSSAEVASSSINILGCLIIALAIATLYFCPPDKLDPFMPQTNSSPSSIDFPFIFINSDAFATSAA